jgi:hypothetical protein
MRHYPQQGLAPIACRVVRPERRRGRYPRRGEGGAPGGVGADVTCSKGPVFGTEPPGPPSDFNIANGRMRISGCVIYFTLYGICRGYIVSGG